jgi:thiol:disulfide interchange protein DsbD
MIKIDPTRKGNRVYENLLGKYEVKGVPTVVFLDHQGKERRNLRLVDYLPAEQFLIRMGAIRNLNPQAIRTFNKRRRSC